VTAPWAKVDVYRTVFIGYVANQLNRCDRVWKFPVCNPDSKPALVTYLACMSCKVYTAHNSLAYPDWAVGYFDFFTE
jgi:hypothetical protein